MPTSVVMALAGGLAAGAGAAIAGTAFWTAFASAFWTTLVIGGVTKLQAKVA